MSETLRELFDELASMPEGERVAQLREVPTELRAELEELLEADAQSAEILSPTWMAELLAPAASQIGKRVGAFELIELIGSGGMGDVFLAERVDGEFEQRAAIKLVRPDRSSEAMVTRFGQERQILAGLNHPNIARLLDGGVTTEGQPFLVMELVDGLPIDDYCEREDLTIEERLRLFTTTCDAVQHTHANLIVHCDLKPDHVLVTDAGDVKLVDFGIATALSSAGDDAPALAMTPEYGAPELFDRANVTTAADVFSLGVILRDLLRGETARARGILGADLSAIASRATSREPRDRYRTPQMMADDVVRALEGRPVAARNEGLLYIARKFVRRHALVLVSAAAMVAVVAAVVLFYTARLAGERDVSRERARRATAASTALASVLTAVDPAVAQGDKVSFETLLKRGRSQLRSQLADQPSLLAEMLVVLGTAQFNLGHYSEAEVTASEVLTIETSLASRSNRVAKAHLQRAEARREQTKLADAEVDINAALEIYREVDGEHSLEVAEALLSRSSMLLDRGDYNEGAAAAAEALALRENLGAPSAALAEALHALAGARASQGNYADAETVYRKAYRLGVDTRGEAHPTTISSLSDLANALRKQGNYAAAEPLYRKALELRKKVFEGDHADIAYNLNHLGRLLYQQGKLDEAEPQLRRGLEMRRRLYGGNHAAVAASLGALSKLKSDQGELDAAEALSRESLGVLASLYGDEHPYIAGATGSLAAIRLRQGDRKEAIELFRRGLAIGRKVLDPKHPQLAILLRGLGGALCKSGSSKEGQTLLAEGLDIVKATFPAEHPSRVAVANAINSCRQ